MSPRLRLVLFLGCGLVASIEAPEAGSWLRAGLSGPYATPAPLAGAQAALSAPAKWPLDLPFAPVLFTLAAGSSALHPTLAVER